ncbi:DinB family protein [Priestia koreensis]|uniref:DinB family protein n=1 Tax=Priestia koreensis TaxID=284581 RepID=UPI001F5823B7|nr:DinB family protein [Priestia koreensis]UNL82981.1 DinB family protein [Priestia koreensis]
MEWKTAVCHQAEIAIRSTKQLIESVSEELFSKKIHEGKRSLGELIAHIAVICEADLHIMKEATVEEMNDFYQRCNVTTKQECLGELEHSFRVFQKEILHVEDIEKKTTSYWGVTYSRAEWYIEIIAHLYHHRGQLHTYLTVLKQKTDVTLFE